MLNQFIRNIKQVNLNSGSPVLIAVSGGVDSIVLAHLAKQYFKNISIAHCNFQLRGEESERDFNFVKSFAHQLAVPFFSVRWDTSLIAKQKNLSIQETARFLRYEWFQEIIERKHTPTEGKDLLSVHPQFLLTAHHADDQIETFFLHLNRGSGLRGLKGILPKNGNIIRPLLNISKKEILEYAEKFSLSFVEDSSNETDKYSRNYFRLNILPQIEERFPLFAQSMLRNIEHLQDAFKLYELKLEELMKDLVEQKNNEIHIPIRKLLKLPANNTILWEIVEQYGFTSAQLKDIESLFEAQSGKYVNSASHQIFKNREWLIIHPLSPATIKNNEGYYIIDDFGEIKFPLGTCLIKEKKFDGDITSDSNIANFDSNKIQFPLILRKWKEGDYFYPLGLGKKKKIARFLIDQKISKSTKENIWVLEMDQKIIWVIGQRIDDRFKLSPNSKEVLSIEFKSYSAKI